MLTADEFFKAAQADTPVVAQGSQPQIIYVPAKSGGSKLWMVFVAAAALIAFGVSTGRITPVLPGVVAVSTQRPAVAPKPTVYVPPVQPVEQAQPAAQADVLPPAAAQPIEQPAAPAVVEMPTANVVPMPTVDASQIVVSRESAATAIANCGSACAAPTVAQAPTIAIPTPIVASDYTVKYMHSNALGKDGYCVIARNPQGEMRKICSDIPVADPKPLAGFIMTGYPVETEPVD